MPVNRNALIRYKTIDKCLQNRRRKWTLEDLIDKVSDALYEYEGIDKIISKRTIQADIQMMRSDKLGYNAPIIVTDKKYYSYDDATYSITNIPLSENDMNTITDIVQVLKQFKGFQHFNELTEVISKLEDKVYSQKHHKKSVIDFEKNENLKGIHFLDELYHAIIHEKVLDIHYQSFTASRSTSLEFHPWLLKEFRNRWFIIGKPSKSNSIFTLALDRIISISYSKKIYQIDETFDAELFYKDVVGVTVSNIKPMNVTLFVSKKQAPYILTKPIHTSQQVVSERENGIIISLKVQHNFELESVLLGFGEGVTVLSPIRLRNAMLAHLHKSIDAYNMSDI